MQRYTTLIVKNQPKPKETLLTNCLSPTSSSTPTNAELLTSLMHHQQPSPLQLLSTATQLSTTVPPLNIPHPDPLAGDLDDLFLQPINPDNQVSQHVVNRSSMANDILLMDSMSSMVTNETVTSSTLLGDSLLQPQVIENLVQTKK